jgi:hypothetical protein
LPTALAALSTGLLTALLLIPAFTVALILLAGLIPLAALLTSLTSLTALLTPLLAALMLLARLIWALLLVITLLRVLRLVLHVGYSSDVLIRPYGRAASRGVDVGQYRPPRARRDFAPVGFRRHGMLTLRCSWLWRQKIHAGRRETGPQ